MMSRPTGKTIEDDALAGSLERRHVRVPSRAPGTPGGAVPDAGSGIHDWNVACEVLSGPSTGIECTEILHIAAAEGNEVTVPASHDCLVFVIDGTGTLKPKAGNHPSRTTALCGPCALFVPAGTGATLQVTSPAARLLAALDLTGAGDPEEGRTSKPQITVIAVNPAFAAGYRGTTGVGSDFAVQPLVSRASGSERLKAFVATVKPGSGMDLHFHRFDQFYFILSGQMEIGVGEDAFTAQAGSLVVIPAGLVHRNRNAGSDDLTQLTIVSHEPPQGRKPSTAVTIHPHGR